MFLKKAEKYTLIGFRLKLQFAFVANYRTASEFSSLSAHSKVKDCN